MKSILFLALAASAVWLSGCATTKRTAGHVTPYHITAYKAHNPNAVRVKVSTSTETLYVMEGDRCLMAAQCCVGKPGAASPSGEHSIGAKIKDKRSGAFGFTSSGAPADIHRGDHVAVGYPMQYWCEFAPSYGFHAGYLWTEPHTHGCIRLHKEAAARLFALVHTGTPVSIAGSQPEDATAGKSVLRIDQRRDPDPPTSLLMSESFFTDPAGPLFVEGQ
ncbi:MAG TPA: L,D-transpeptidase [Chthoniobacteraceae bacterium]|nr:L,D-transpeptidase [Chthoniobacteraceae bacterium]